MRIVLELRSFFFTNLVMAVGSESMTIRGAVANLCNTCIGIGILAKPYALALTGWSGIFAFLLAALLVTYGGICLAFASRVLLIQNKSIMMSKPIINETNKQNNYNSTNNNDIEKQDSTTPIAPKRTKSAFQLVSRESMGSYGEMYSVIGFAMIAWIVTSTCIIMVFELIQQITSQISINHTIDSSLIFLCSFILYIPAALLLKMKQITFISWIGVISVIAILLTLILLMIQSLIQFNGPPPIPLLIKNIENNHQINSHSTNLAGNAGKNMNFVEKFGFSLVLFMGGISGNAAVPKIAATLNNKKHLIWVVGLSYVMVATFYCFIAAIGYWLYDEYTDVMIINNFFIWPNNSIIIIVSALVIANLWASFSIMLSLICDIFDSMLNLKLNQIGYRRLVRMMMLCFTFVSAYLMRYHLSFLVTLGGVVGTLCSLILTMPLIVYLCTFWNHPTQQLSMLGKIFHVVLLVVSVLIGLMAGYQDFAKVL